MTPPAAGSGGRPVGRPRATDGATATTRWSTPSAGSPTRSRTCIGVIRDPEILQAIGQTDRTNLAKYLTIARIRLDNAIAVVRSGDTDRTAEPATDPPLRATPDGRHDEAGARAPASLRSRGRWAPLGVRFGWSRPEPARLGSVRRRLGGALGRLVGLGPALAASRAALRLGRFASRAAFAASFAACLASSAAAHASGVMSSRVSGSAPSATGSFVRCATQETQAPWFAKPVGRLHLGGLRHDRAVVARGVGRRPPRRLGGLVALLGIERPPRRAASSSSSAASSAWPARTGTVLPAASAAVSQAVR